MWTLKVNWCELVILTEKGKPIYRNRSDTIAFLRLMRYGVIALIYYYHTV